MNTTVDELVSLDRASKWKPRTELAQALAKACFEAGEQPSHEGIARLIDNRCGVRVGSNGKFREQNPKTISEWISGNRNIQPLQKSRIQKTLQCNTLQIETLCRKKQLAESRLTDSYLPTEVVPITGMNRILETPVIERDFAHDKVQTRSNQNYNNRRTKSHHTDIPTVSLLRRRVEAFLALAVSAVTIAAATVIGIGSIDKTNLDFREQGMKANKSSSDLQNEKISVGCPIQFSRRQSVLTDCAEKGVYKISGNLFENWNIKSSAVFIPDGARAIGHYQSRTSSASDLDYDDNIKYFLLRPGYNRLDHEIYYLYHDPELRIFHRTSNADELNNKLQGISILDMNEGAILVWKNDKTDSAHPLSIRKLTIQ